MVASFKETADHVSPGEFATFADGVRDLIGLAQTQAHAATFVAHYNEGAEIESATAFDHLGGTVDEHDLFRQFPTLATVRVRVGIVARPTATACTAKAASPASIASSIFS